MYALKFERNQGEAEAKAEARLEGRKELTRRMKVVGLVSGGKDSCYAMMRCIDYGHEIVALANLLPLEDSVDELDSYMYQTVGHQIIVTYSQCMGLPLFRRRLRGTSRFQELKYTETQGDEVEDLMILLSEVKKQIPSIQGVSSGAIASDYQRLRVESVCSRLGLISLAFLWKQEQGLLLQEMIDKGIEAILVKVAAMGLHPNKHLGRDIVALQPYLLQLKELYGINVCGEGGEYETLTLDCSLFKNARIVIDKYEIMLHSLDSIAPVGILHPSLFHLEPKLENTDPRVSNHGTFMNRSVTEWVIEVEGNDIIGICEDANQLDTPPVDLEMDHKRSLITSKTQNDILTIGCWLQSSLNPMQGLENHLGLILKGIECRLKEDQLGWEDVLYIHLYLADMNQFALANDTYVRYVMEENCPCGVPSRSTVEIPLSEGGLGNAFVEVLASKDKTKKVLHVQSISCWAPSCIGPYSQATLHRQILYMAGQLGLDPPTMLLTSGGAGVQMQQALMNCEAVANVFGCSLGPSLISLTVYCPTSLTSCERSEVHDALEKIIHHGTAMSGDSNITTEKHEKCRPLVLYILVSALPKRALVEVKPILYVPVPEEDIDSEGELGGRASCSAEIEVNEDDGHCGDEQLASLSCCDSFEVCGLICASTVTVTPDVICEICNQTLDEVFPSCPSNINVIEQKECLASVARYCIHALNRKLQKACLVWEDVLNFRVYFVANPIPIDLLKAAFTEAAELYGLKRGFPLFKNDISLGSPVTSFIPVFGIGRTAEMTAFITCELFASRC